MSRSETEAAPLRVLVVEDEFLIALDIQDLIEDFGHTVVGVADCSAVAEKIARESNPDVATVDLRLRDGQNGAEVAAWLDREMGVHLIFVSGNLDANMREDLARLDPVAFVGKPISPHLLQRALDRAVEKVNGGTR